MKKTAFLLIPAALLLLSGALPSIAAEGSSEAARQETAIASEWIRGLAETLELSIEQLPRFEAALLAGFRRRLEILDRYAETAGSASIESLREEIALSQQQTRDEVSEFLSPEQLDGLEAAHEEGKAEIGGLLVVHRLRERLGLTAQQERQLVPIFAEDLEAKQELIGKAKASRRLSSRRAVQSEMKKQRAQLERKLEAILSETQMAEYRVWVEQAGAEMRERLRGRGGGFRR